jgi:hypothetical protein
MGIMLDILVTLDTQGVDRHSQRAIALHSVEVVAGDAPFLTQRLVDRRCIGRQSRPRRQLVGVTDSARFRQLPPLYASLVRVVTGAAGWQCFVVEVLGDLLAHGCNLLLVARAAQRPFRLTQQSHLLPTMTGVTQQALPGCQLGVRLLHRLLLLVALGTCLRLGLSQQVHLLPAVKGVAGQAIPLLLDGLVAHRWHRRENFLVAFPAPRRSNVRLGHAGVWIVAGGTFSGLIFRVCHEHRALGHVVSMAAGAQLLLRLAQDGLDLAAVPGVTQQALTSRHLGMGLPIHGEIFVAIETGLGLRFEE